MKKHLQQLGNDILVYVIGFLTHHDWLGLGRDNLLYCTMFCLSKWWCKWVRTVSWNFQFHSSLLSPFANQNPIHCHALSSIWQHVNISQLSKNVKSLMLKNFETSDLRALTQLKSLHLLIKKQKKPLQLPPNLLFLRLVDIHCSNCTYHTIECPDQLHTLFLFGICRVILNPSLHTLILRKTKFPSLKNVTALTTVKVEHAIFELPDLSHLTTLRSLHLVIWAEPMPTQIKY